MERDMKTFSSEICYKSPITYSGGTCKDPHKIQVIEDGLQPKNLYTRSTKDLTRKRLSSTGPQKENVAFNFVKERLMTIQLLVLPKVTCLLKGHKMHTQIAKRVALFQEDIQMAIQVAVCKQKEGTIESIIRIVYSYSCTRFKDALCVCYELST